MLNQLYKSSPWLRARAHRVKDAATYRLARAALGIGAHYRLERSLAAADRLGDIAYLVLHKTRRLALGHLELVFADQLSERRRHEIVRSSLRGFARSFCEIANIDEIRPNLATYITMTGWDEVAEAIREGAITCAAHLGNWELLAVYIAEIQGKSVAAVARRLDEPRLNQLLVDFRRGNGVETILRDSPSAGRQILRTLKQGGILAMLVDQDTRVSSITVPFLGHPARTPVAPATLALRRGIPIVTSYSRRRPAGGLEIVMGGPLYPDNSLTKEDAIRDLTERVNDLLGAAILENPDQWPWWHRRWRRPPQPRLDPDAPID